MTATNETQSILTKDIVVTELGKYGPKVNGEFYSYSKFFTGEKLQVGEKAVIEVYVSPSGKNYINKIAARETVKVVPVAPSQAKDRDYDAENRGKTRCQLVAASMPILLTGYIDLNEYKEKANQLVEYVMTGK